MRSENEISRTERDDGYTVVVLIDDDPNNPREDMGPMGSMLCWYKQYNLGDVEASKEYSPEDHEDWEGLRKEILSDLGEEALVLDLYLYEHSGLTISLSPFSCPWDTGQVGFMVLSEPAIRAEFPDLPYDQAKKRCHDYLKGEVAMYNDYLTGQVFGFEVIRPDGSPGESCYGFYGDDLSASGLNDAVEEYIAADIKAVTPSQVVSKVSIEICCGEGGYDTTPLWKLRRMLDLASLKLEDLICSTSPEEKVNFFITRGFHKGTLTVQFKQEDKEDKEDKEDTE